MLKPGVYFANAGVFGCLDCYQTVLNRLVDVIVFNVQLMSNQKTTEVVNFEFNSEVSYL